MTNEEIQAPRIPKAVSFPVSLLASAGLFAAAGAIAYSLVGALFGTRAEDPWLWGVFGLLSIAIVGLYISVCRPAPLARMWPALFGFGRLLGHLGRALFGAAFLAMILMFGGCSHGRAPPYDSLPVFAPRSEYTLQGGPQGYFKVSRFRFLLAAAGFQLGWHFGALGATLLTQASLYCGTCRKPSSEGRVD